MVAQRASRRTATATRADGLATRDRRDLGPGAVSSTTGPPVLCLTEGVAVRKLLRSGVFFAVIRNYAACLHDSHYMTALLIPSPTAFRLRLCCCCCSVLSLSPHSKSHDTNTIHGLSSWNRSAQTFTCNIKEKRSISDLPLCCSRLVYWPADPQTIITNHGLLNLLSRPDSSVSRARTHRTKSKNPAHKEEVFTPPHSLKHAALCSHSRPPLGSLLSCEPVGRIILSGVRVDADGALTAAVGPVARSSRIAPAARAAAKARAEESAHAAAQREEGKRRRVSAKVYGPS